MATVNITSQEFQIWSPSRKLVPHMSSLCLGKICKARINRNVSKRKGNYYSKHCSNTHEQKMSEMKPHQIVRNLCFWILLYILNLKITHNFVQYSGSRETDPCRRIRWNLPPICDSRGTQVRTSYYRNLDTENGSQHSW